MNASIPIYAGIDEVGRGCLAGPVCAACVILPSTFDRTLLADSKKLTALKRQKVAHIIFNECQWGLGWVDVQTIDKINILQASLLAMNLAYKQLNYPVTLIYIDGPHAPMMDVPVQTVIRGDQSIHEIMAASIIAKVARDNYMTELDSRMPAYGFAQHKGYGTKKHRNTIQTHGASAHHRHSFKLL
jgi:ribonuclease HII